MSPRRRRVFWRSCADLKEQQGNKFVCFEILRNQLKIISRPTAHHNGDGDRILRTLHSRLCEFQEKRAN